MNAANPSLLSALNVQKRVIGALLMRETQTRYGRHNIGFLWLFVEPALITSVVVGIWLALGRGYQNVPVAPFVVTGYVPFLCWRYCASRSLLALSANASLMFHRNVRALDIFFARNLLEVAGTLLAFIVLLGGLAITGYGQIRGDLLLVLTGWMLLAWFSVAVSLVLCALSEIADVLERIWSPIMFLTLPLSGVFYMVDWLPTWLRDKALLFPLVHCIEMIRAGVLGPTYRFYYDVPYVILVCAVLSLAGLVLLREVRQQLDTA